MTKKTANRNATSFHSIINRVDTIVEQRRQWQSTVFADSNEALYAILQQIYELYEHTRSSTKLSGEVILPSNSGHSITPLSGPRMPQG